MADEEVHFEPANLDDPMDRSADATDEIDNSWIQKLRDDAFKSFGSEDVANLRLYVKENADVIPPEAMKLFEEFISKLESGETTIES